MLGHNVVTRDQILILTKPESEAERSVSKKVSVSQTKAQRKAQMCQNYRKLFIISDKHLFMRISTGARRCRSEASENCSHRSFMLDPFR